MLPLDSLLVFPVSLASPPLYRYNFIDFPSPPALNSKFFSPFLSLNSVLLLNTVAITSDSLSLPPLSAISALPNAIIFSCLVLGQPWPTLGPCFYWSVTQESPPSSFSLAYSLCSPFLVSPWP